MIQALKLSDQVARTYLAVDMLERTDASPHFHHQVCFSDEATFHINGVVNRYNCRILGSQNPHATCEMERGGPKLNVWAGLMHDNLIGPFFFPEKTVTGCSYLDMQKLHALPQLLPKLSSSKMRHHHISAMLGIAWTERWLGDGSAKVNQSLCLLGHQI
jgi:hypothetical protein